MNPFDYYYMHHCPFTCTPVHELYNRIAHLQLIGCGGINSAGQGHNGIGFLPAETYVVTE